MTNYFSLPYAKDNLTFLLDEKYDVHQFMPKKLMAETDANTIVLSAIRNPLNNLGLPAKVDPQTTVAVTINDKTRPVPNNQLFPLLLDQLIQIGVKKENIIILIAVGTHSPMPVDEHSHLLQKEILQQFKVVSHDCDNESNLTYRGTTSRGTPVFVNSLYDRADIKIVVGDIEPHHFAGFSGGAKSASIGVCGRKTINQNHSLLQDSKSVVGRFEDNPLRQDIEEIGQLIGIDLALNAILNEKKEILHVLFGSPKAVIEAGVKIIRDSELTLIPHLYDLVIASAGGYPKDINLYQAQKALTHASLFCKNGGTVILAAACDEGIGSQSYFEFMQGINSHAEAREKFLNTGFSVGPHKALQFALIAERINFQLLSNIESKVLQKLLIMPVIDLDASIQKVLNSISYTPRIAVIPYATATIPQYRGDLNGK